MSVNSLVGQIALEMDDSRSYAFSATLGVPHGYIHYLIPGSCLAEASLSSVSIKTTLVRLDEKYSGVGALSIGAIPRYRK